MSYTYKIEGLDCADEVAVLKKELGPLVGENNLSFDILNGRMSVVPENGTFPEKEVLRRVERTGMRASRWEPGKADSQRSGSRSRLNFRTVLTALSGICTLTGFLLHVLLAGSAAAAIGHGAASYAPPPAVILLYSLAILCGVWLVLPKAWYSLRHLRPDMNLLMTIAVLGAVAIGEWFEGATVATLFALSLALESWSVGRARRAVAALMDLAPPTARIRTDEGSEVERRPREVPVGSVVIVKPGERIPLDGRVIEGIGEVNQAPVTGESIPVAKEPGDEVYAGTINGSGALEFRTTKPADETTLANIIRMVSEAQKKRARAEQWVDRFARIYTPAVIALAAAVLLIPPLLFGGLWSEWIYRSLVLLVIGCPCALVISTPVSIVAALAAAARNGVLVKGGIFMEIPARLKAIAFDKTGTVTVGAPEVTSVIPLNGHSEIELLERAAAMEARSEHPLARAVMEYSRRQGVAPAAARDFRMLPGRGATALINDRKYWIGSHRYLTERGQETDEVRSHLSHISSMGASVIAVGSEEHVCGLLTVADSVRPQTKEIMEELRREGIEHLIMLTGDNRATAEVIAFRTGVDEYRAELLPESKVEAVEALTNRYGAVAMVGDGVNDAPAMGRSSLGIAMGAVGTDAAIETADVALMSDDLSKLPWLIRHSRRTIQIIRANIIFALAVKVVFVALTFLGEASLWAAIAADMGASLLVIFNALRLLGSPTAMLSKQDNEKGDDDAGGLQVEAGCCDACCG